MKNVKMLGLLMAAIGVLVLPASAAAQEANGDDCSYADVNTGGPGFAAGVEAGGDGMSGNSAVTAVGACVNAPTPDGTLQGGSGEIGTANGQVYAVIDGDNQNVDPLDGYAGLSNYEDGDPALSTTPAECTASGPDNGEAGTTNSGGCFGFDTGQWVPLPRIVPTPMCGNSSGNEWWNTNRDGCSNP